MIYTVITMAMQAIVILEHFTGFRIIANRAAAFCATDAVKKDCLSAAADKGLHRTTGLGKPGLADLSMDGGNADLQPVNSFMQRIGIQILRFYS